MTLAKKDQWAATACNSIQCIAWWKSLTSSSCIQKHCVLIVGITVRCRSQRAGGHDQKDNKAQPVKKKSLILESSLQHFQWHAVCDPHFAWNYCVHFGQVLCVDLPWQVRKFTKTQRWPRFGFRAPWFLQDHVAPYVPIWGDYEPEADPLNMRIATWHV